MREIKLLMVKEKVLEQMDLELKLLREALSLYKRIEMRLDMFERAYGSHCKLALLRVKTWERYQRRLIRYSETKFGMNEDGTAINWPK